jgi:hypothetical protein
MTTLRVREGDEHDEPARLGRVVVRDGRLEMLAHRCRLAELAAKPAEQAHRGLVGHGRTLPCGARVVAHAHKGVTRSPMDTFDGSALTGAPEETALSILGEILAVRAGRSGGSLKRSPQRIHAEIESAAS